MKKIMFFLMISILLIIPMISAESYIFKQNRYSDLVVPCITDTEDRCDALVECNLTANYPNGSVLIDDEIMTNKGNGYFNYTLNENQTSILGEYSTYVQCEDINVSGFSSFNYLITETGFESPSGIVTTTFFIFLFLVFLSLLVTSFTTITRTAVKEFYIIDVIMAISAYMFLLIYHFLARTYFPIDWVLELLMVLTKVGVWTHIVLPIVAFTIVLMLNWNRYKVERDNRDGYDGTPMNDSFNPFQRRNNQTFEADPYKGNTDPYKGSNFY